MIEQDCYPQRERLLKYAPDTPRPELWPGVVVGACGVGLSSDDLVFDVRDDYREMIEDGAPDEDAVRRLLDKYAPALADFDEGPDGVVAMAVSQSRPSRLDGQVRSQTLGMIDGGADLVRWIGTPQLAAAASPTSRH
jgi:hypothetical protein